MSQMLPLRAAVAAKSGCHLRSRSKYCAVRQDDAGNDDIFRQPGLMALLLDVVSQPVKAVAEVFWFGNSTGENVGDNRRFGKHNLHGCFPREVVSLPLRNHKHNGLLASSNVARRSHYVIAYCSEPRTPAGPTTALAARAADQSAAPIPHYGLAGPALNHGRSMAAITKPAPHSLPFSPEGRDKSPAFDAPRCRARSISTGAI